MTAAVLMNLGFAGSGVVVVVRSNVIDLVEPPALPFAPIDYNRRMLDQNNNVLRLFFNRFVNNTRTLFDTTGAGGRVLYFPRGKFISTADQAIAIVDTEQAVTFTNTQITSKVTLVSDSRITVALDGVYSFHFSGQLDKINAGVATFFLWYSKNGSNVTNSGRKYTVNGATDENTAELIFSVELRATDYVEIMVSADDTDASLEAIAGTSVHPGVPSAVLTVNFESNH